MTFKNNSKTPLKETDDPVEWTKKTLKTLYVLVSKLGYFKALINLLLK